MNAWLELMQQLPLGDSLPLRKNVCSDCAVKCGLYAEYSDALKEADSAEQFERSRQWYCHNTPSMACRGNAENQGIEW